MNTKTELIQQLTDIMDDKQVEDIVTIDFRDKSPFLDYFLIGSVRNGRMANAVLEAIDDHCGREGIKVRHIDNDPSSKWFLIDLGSVVVHIFYDGEREKYDLEGLWKDLIKK